MFFLRPPSDERIRALLHERAEAPFTYPEVGATKTTPMAAPAGFHADAYGTPLGRGRACFDRAIQILSRIGNYPPSFTRIVRAHDPVDHRVLEPGGLFATVASHLGFASVHPSRIIYVIREEQRFGFGFGTLPGHAESGEERFLITMDDEEDVRYEVQAFSRPIGFVSRFGARITRGYQLRFQRETQRVMRELSAE